METIDNNSSKVISKCIILRNVSDFFCCCAFVTVAVKNVRNLGCGCDSELASLG